MASAVIAAGYCCLQQIQQDAHDLAKDRDNFKILYEQVGPVPAGCCRSCECFSLSAQAREDLQQVRSEVAGLPSSGQLRLVAVERDEAVEGLARVTAEGERLRERLRLAEESSAEERRGLQQQVEELQGQLQEVGGGAGRALVIGNVCPVWNSLSFSCLARTHLCHSASPASERLFPAWRLSCKVPLRPWPSAELMPSRMVAVSGSCRWVGHLGGAGGWQKEEVTAVMAGCDLSVWAARPSWTVVRVRGWWTRALPRCRGRSWRGRGLS